MLFSFDYESDTQFLRVLRVKRRRQIHVNNFDPEPLVHLHTRSFPRTTGLPPPNPNAPYPLLNDPLPAAYLGRRDRRVRGHDVDTDGRRHRAATTDLDHDGPLSGKDLLPAYDYFGGPPKYAELDLQRSSMTENTTLPAPQNSTTTTTVPPVPENNTLLEDPSQTTSQNVALQLSVPTNPEPPTSHSNSP